MKILKKIFGVILLILAGLLSLATLVTALRGILQTITELNQSGATGVGHAIGSLLSVAFFVAIIYFTAKTGLKLIRSDKQAENAIEEIGT